MTALLKRLYQPKYLVKKSLQLGEAPTTSEGYGKAFSTASAAIAETFLVALIGMADTIMVGGLGPDAIAAVGITSQPRYLVQTLIMALNIAVTSICARRFGERNQEGAISTLKQGLLLSTLFSIILALISIPLTVPMIRMMGAEEAIIPYATDYLRIILIGLPLNSISLTISSALRGIGETRASMVINMSANIVNIIFNYLLINGIGIFPRLEVAGAAIATVIGFGVAMLIAIWMILRKNMYLTVRSKDGWRFDARTLRSMYEVASGSFVEGLVVRGGFMLYARIIASLGTVMLAAHQILLNLLSLSFSFGDGFGISAASLVGQNLGAKRPDLSIIYGKICQRMSIISSAVVFFLFAFAGEFMVRAFTDNQEIIETSKPILVLMGFVIFAQATQMVYMGSLRGAGDTKYTAVISAISILTIRPIIGYLLTSVFHWGLLGAWIALAIDQFLRMILTYTRFSSGKWTKIEL